MISLLLGVVFCLTPEEQQKSIDNWNRIAAKRPGAAAAQKRIQQTNGN